MEIINYKDINLSSMKSAIIQGTKSSVYINDNECYKILDGLYNDEKKQLLKKFYDMDGIDIENILFPKKIILDNEMLVGYTMDYFPQSINLNDYFTKNRFIDINDIFVATKKVSKILRKAHENRIILQDFSFDNILIDDNKNIKICDIDGCFYNEIKGPCISMIMHHYCNIFPDDYFILNENFDNQSLLLSMLCIIYHKMILKINDYDTLSDKINTLKSIRTIVSSLLKNSKTKVPYLDEIINDNDHFIIDRNKQVSFKKRLMRDYSIY